jgi:T-complex protein 1 subunit theta
MPADVKTFNVDNIRVAKVLGGSLSDSVVIHGLAILRGSETTVHHVTAAKVAVFNCDLAAESGDTKGTVVFKTADELINYTRSEEDTMEKFIKKCADAGVNVVFVGGSISDIAVHFCQKYNIMLLKIMSKFDLRRIAKAVGATLLVRHDSPTPDEMGHAESISTDEIASQKITIIKRNEDENRMATILIRGSTISMIEDSERAIDDGVNTFKNITRDARFVAGGGATEIYIASQLQTFAKTQPGLD